jgi:hypothetical protein
MPTKRKLCECGCGQPVRYHNGKPSRFIVGHSLRYFSPKTRAAKTRAAKRTPPMSHTPEYAAYWDARERCRNPKVHNWMRYGGRGIKFLFTSFEKFYAHIGPRPSSTHSLDRIENDGNYEAGNVRWATKEQQNDNRRYTKRQAQTTVGTTTTHVSPTT